MDEGNAAGRHQSWRWWIAALVASLPFLFVIGSYLLWRDRLPDPLPSHWGADGKVDGTTSLTGTVTAMAVMARVGSLPAWVGALAHRLSWNVRRVLIAVGAAAGGFAAGLWLTVATLALDLTDPYRAPEPTWQIPALLVAMTAAPAVAVGLLGRAPERRAAPDRPAPDLPRTPLGAGEQPVWRETFPPPRGFLVVPALLLGLAAVMAAVVNIWAASPVLVVAVGCGLFASARLTVDQRGLHIALGWWGWPRFTVPLAEVAAAEVTEVSLFEWGGWGYRARPGGRALVFRSGPGIRLTLSEEREFVFNTRDPERVAGLVNSLIEHADGDRRPLTHHRGPGGRPEDVASSGGRNVEGSDGQPHQPGPSQQDVRRGG